jgi:protease PrsW
VADLLCYLRLYTELSLRAKGILMMRENGFEAEVDAETRERFAEMEFLERSIGRTGLVALHPLLRMGRKELWQLYMLKGRGA